MAWAVQANLHTIEWGTACSPRSAEGPVAGGPLLWRPRARTGSRKTLDEIITPAANKLLTDYPGTQAYANRFSHAGSMQCGRSKHDRLGMTALTESRRA